MKNLDEWLRNILGISHDLQTKLLASLIALFLLWLIRKIALKIADKRNPDVRVRYRWRKVSIYIAFAIGVFLIGRIWFEGFQSISTYLGLLSAGLAIALQDPTAGHREQAYRAHEWSGRDEVEEGGTEFYDLLHQVDTDRLYERKGLRRFADGALSLRAAQAEG